MREADWEKLKDDYQSLKAPEQLQPRILLAMEPQRSGLTPVRVWQFAIRDVACGQFH